MNQKKCGLVGCGVDYTRFWFCGRHSRTGNSNEQGKFQHLRAFATNTTSKLDALWRGGDTFGVGARKREKRGTRKEQGREVREEERGEKERERWEVERSRGR